MVTATPSALELAGDEILADRAADGDTRAFAVLARRHRRLLRAYATRILGSSADADDVVQNTLVSAWKQLPTLRDRAQVRSWLLQITSRNAIDVIRSRKQHDDITELDVLDPANTPAEESELRSVQHALREALNTLPAAQRQVWVLRELGGLSYDEVAAETGLSTSTVRGLLARARTRLIRDMQGWR